MQIPPPAHPSCRRHHHWQKRLPFAECVSLTHVTLPTALTTIGHWAFRNCASLALTILPDGLVSIALSAFEKCTSLALTSLPDSLTSIGDGAFYGCHRIAVTLHSLPPTAPPLGVYTLEVAEKRNRRNRARRERKRVNGRARAQEKQDVLKRKSRCITCFSICCSLLFYLLLVP